MKIFTPVITAIFLLFVDGPLLCQGIFLGLQAGPNIPHLTSITEVDGIETEGSKAIDGWDKLGYHAGIYIGMEVAKRWLIQAEGGYEHLQFSNFSISPEKGRIHHRKAGLLLGYRPLQQVALLCGLEAVWRSNDLVGYGTQKRGLNGDDAEGFYWQGVAGIHYEFKNQIRLGLRMTIPRIGSLQETPITINNSVEGLLIEQLRAFQFSVSLPIKKNWLLVPAKLLL